MVEHSTMKRILISLSSLALVSFSHFHPILKPGDLQGKWTLEDNTHQLDPIALNFTDTRHVMLSILNEGSNNLNYTIDNSHDLIIIHFKGINADKEPMNIDWLVKIIDGNTFMAEEPLFDDPTKWDDDVAITMVRVK
jgi:hypothetical protein